MVFPAKGEAASDSVMVIGKQADVKRAIEMLEAMVREQVCTTVSCRRRAMIAVYITQILLCGYLCFFGLNRLSVRVDFAVTSSGVVCRKIRWLRRWR